MRRRVVSVLLLAALVAPALGGCVGNPVETLIEQGTGGGVELGGGSVPEGFPAEVPLYDGEIAYAVGVGDGAGRAFNVTVRVPDQAAGEQIRTDLEAAGFTLIAGTAPDAQGGAVYDGANWGVAVVLTQDGDGWVANYTVTPKQSTGSQG